MHHLRTTHAIVGCVSICLEKSLEVAEEVQWALAFAAHAEIENRHSARRPVLPEVSLMIGAASVVCLYIDRSFIRLDIGTGKQLVPHRSDYRHQHLPDGHHPTAHRSPADIDARVTQQCYALPKEWAVVAIFIHHRVDHHSIRHQAFVDDSDGKSRRRHALFGTGFACPLLAFGYLDEIPRRLHIQYFADFVANHGSLSAAVTAYALLRRAGYHPFHTGKIRGQSLTSGMLAFLLFSNWRRGLALAFGDYFFPANPKLLFQQFELQIA